jgi:hypothetical protein
MPLPRIAVIAAAIAQYLVCRVIGEAGDAEVLYRADQVMREASEPRYAVIAIVRHRPISPGERRAPTIIVIAVAAKTRRNRASAHSITGFGKGYAVLVCKPLLRLGDLQYQRETGR